MLYGASFRNKGVHPLLDAIVDYLPSPADIRPVAGHHPKTQAEEARPASDEAPFSGLVFKIANDAFLGNLAYFRVYSGKAKVGQSIYNSTKGEEEKLSRLLEMHANKRKEIKEIYAGDIAAMGSTKAISTGDTLCLKSHPIVLESIRFPEPVIAATIEPKTKADHPKLAVTLAKLTREDPTLKVSQDPMTGQTLLQGMGELHLEIVMDRMEREFGVRANLGKPQVAYKETIQAEADGEGKYVRQAGGKGLYGHCVLRLEPLRRGQGFEFAGSSSSTSRTASGRPSRAASWPASPSRTSARRSSAGRTTRSTPRPSPTRSPRRWPSARRPRRPARSSSSRSWTSRWSARTTTWGPSSATSTPAGARSRAWRRAAAPG